MVGTVYDIISLTAPSHDHLMSADQPSYFLVPSWDLGPDDVVLGSVIANVKRPQMPLMGKSPAISIDTKIQMQGPQVSSGTVKFSTEQSVGLFSNFLQAVTVGGEVSYASKQTKQLEYSCDKMETRKFVPSTEYINSVVQDATISTYLKSGGLSSKVFVITGLKIASEITITTTLEDGYEAKAQVGIDLLAGGLKIGPQGSWKSETSKTHTTTIKGPIVFAFQVKKLRKHLVGGLKSKDVVKGAMLGKEKTSEREFELVRDDVGLGDVEDFGMEMRSAIDEYGEQCRMIF